MTHACEQTPSWSPLGGRIAFVTRGEVAAAIVLISSSGSAKATIAVGDVASPAWSPDGSSLAFVDDGDIVVYDVASNTRHAVANTEQSSISGRVIDVSWSADGTSLLYTRGEITRFSGKYGTVICRIAPDGTGFEQLTDRDADARPRQRS